MRIISRTMLTLFSRPTCAPCRVVKTWLTNKGIDFVEKPAEGAEYLAHAERYGSMVPLIIKGDSGISGLDFSRLNRLLEQ